MQKEYIEPVFQFIKTDEENKVFFGASNTPVNVTLGGQTRDGATW